MIKLFEYFDQLDKSLSSLIGKNIIEDYRLIMNSNMTISVYVKGDNVNKESVSKSIESEFVNISYVNEENDPYIDDLFSKPQSHDTTYSQRHLSNLLQPVDIVQHNVPVVTFYSYKGGVGRTTALASCASYLAYHYKKKIVILDCDFEAPGFTNFYLEASNSQNHHDGLVEYFIDSDFFDENLKKYYWEVSKCFTGDGNIYVFPAGNLSDTELYNQLFPTELSHYVNGLTRLDIFSKDGMVIQFTKLFKKIEDEIKPDVIFIDSRTGFNDMYGISAYRLSDIVVGFFGGNEQTKPGLHFFLDMIKQQQTPQLFVVNSIIPQTMRRERFASFKEDVQSYLTDLSEENGDTDILSVDIFPISRNAILDDIGTSFGDYRDFIELIVQKTFPEYNSLFDKLNESIDSKVHSFLNNNEAKIEKKQNIKQITTTLLDSKTEILQTLHNKMPELYAEDIDNFQREFDENRYFFRKCMEDLFNTNKILVLGNKGTGKSYIYKSLKEPSIVKELKKRANISFDKLTFIHVVDSNRKFDTIKFDKMEIDDPDLFYERFWIVYIWNAIMQDQPFGYQSGLGIRQIENDTSTSKWFEQIINNDEMIILIENDLKKLDLFLNDLNARIIFIFDELDNIVKPHKWSERISPLINCCKQMSYSSMFPKIFLRSDLFEKISGINNKNALANKAINIEWNREELFAYFFNLVLSQSFEPFFILMKKNADFPTSYVNKITGKIRQNSNQPTLDEYTLRHLCYVFFGRYADTEKSPRYGESYDWFFKNLKNANDTISLRPFIDLITLSVNEALIDDKSETPILPQKYYTNGNLRAKAVENHLKDLAKETGNTDLMPIFDYISTKAGIKYKKERLSQKDFYDLLDQILNNCELTDNNDRDSLISFLEINGVIRSRIVRNSIGPMRIFEFAYLYKYYLGLKGKGRRK